MRKYPMNPKARETANRRKRRMGGPLGFIGLVLVMNSSFSSSFSLAPNSLGGGGGGGGKKPRRSQPPSELTISHRALLPSHIRALNTKECVRLCSRHADGFQVGISTAAVPARKHLRFAPHTTSTQPGHRQGSRETFIVLLALAVRCPPH